MSVQGDRRPPDRGSFDKATVDRWQVYGGMAGVAALLLSVVGGIQDLVPLSLVAAGVVTLVGVTLLFRWGRRPQRHTITAFVLPVVVTIVGAATAGLLGGLELGTEVVEPSGVVDARTSTTNPPGGAQGERRSGHVSLTSNYHIDLDTTTAPNAGVTREGTRDTDLHFILSVFTAKDVARVPGPPSYQDCVSATGLRNGIDDGELEKGAAFCVQTTEGRWAGLTITEVGSDSLEFDLVVWEQRQV